MIGLRLGLVIRFDTVFQPEYFINSLLEVHVYVLYGTLSPLSNSEGGQPPIFGPLKFATLEKQGERIAPLPPPPTPKVSMLDGFHIGRLSLCILGRHFINV